MPIKKQQFIDEVSRQRRRAAYGPKMLILKGGSANKIRHNLGRIPNIITIQPVMHNGGCALHWWHKRFPDGEYVYIVPSATGHFLVYISEV
jgi:hypothetical protein